MALAWLSCLLLALLPGCDPGPPATEASAPAGWDELWAAAGRVDTVGAAQITVGDTISGHHGLTLVEMTVRFPATAAGAEAFAWEANICALEPLKLIIVAFDRQGQRFELLGESETHVPRHLGLNKFILREPIPLRHGCHFGLHMPAGEAVPFSVVPNWKTLITTAGLRRPYMEREAFAMYGWRHAVRVFWRPGGDR